MLNFNALSVTLRSSLGKIPTFWAANVLEPFAVGRILREGPFGVGRLGSSERRGLIWGKVPPPIMTGFPLEVEELQILTLLRD